MTNAKPAHSIDPRRRFFRIGLFGQLILTGLLVELILLVLWITPPPWGVMVQLNNFARILHLRLLGTIMLMPFGEGLVGAFSWVVLCAFLWLVLLGAIGGLMFKLVTQPAKWLLARWGVSTRQKTMLAGSVLGLVAIAAVVYVTMFALRARPVPFSPSAEIESIVNGNAALALKLYHQLGTEPGNLFFSPLSISTAMAMTYAGARGQTAAEMADTLHFDLPQDKLHVAFGALIKRMDKLQRWGRIQLVMANSLWCQREYKYTETFLDIVQNHYRGEARQVDFVKAPGAAASEINQWVASRTNRKITEAVTPSAVTHLTRLVLCNAIYFKGKWLKQFAVGNTRPAPFYVSPDMTVTVPMMYQKADFKTTYSDDYSVHMLEMPYSGKDLSMVIFLPEREDPLSDAGASTLRELERKLTPENLKVWLAKLDETTPRETAVYFPRFTITQTFNLIKTLQHIGMASAFGMDADFSGINGTTNLFISDVFHNAFVEVNETGTKAAGATLTLVTLGRHNVFRADHPFIFLIRDNASGAILFFGRVVDPSQR